MTFNKLNKIFKFQKSSAFKNKSLKKYVCGLEFYFVIFDKQYNKKELHEIIETH